MSIKTRTEPRTNKDTPRPDLVDNRGGTFDPGPNKGTHEIYTNSDNLPEGLRGKREGPLGPTQGRRGGNKE
jgi:hypothetical protein